MLNGITNGIDMDEWDPARDAQTPAPFTAEDTSGKAACKAALQAELGLDVDARVSPWPVGSRVHPSLLLVKAVSSETPRAALQAELGFGHGCQGELWGLVPVSGSAHVLSFVWQPHKLFWRRRRRILHHSGPCRFGRT